MKNILLLFLFLNGICRAQQHTQIQVLSNQPNQILLDIEVGGLKQSPVMTPLGPASTIQIEQGTALLEKGCPDLPKLAFSLQIPGDREAEVSVESASYTDYLGVMIAPGKGNLSRTQKPSDVPFTFGSVYQKNEFYPTSMVDAGKPFILRDFRGQSIQIFPVRYNPVSKVLRVYHHLKLNIQYSRSSAHNLWTSWKSPEKVVAEYDDIYRNLFLNYGLKGTRYSPVKQNGSMLVLCPASYLNAIKPYIEWKEQKGIEVLLVNTDTLTGGVFEPTVLNLVSQYYAEKQIAYLLIVGDHPNIPTRNANWNQYPDLLGPSDNAYAYQSGNDHAPEFIVGRFSGESAADISVQVERTLRYEKNPYLGTAWYKKQIGMASNQGPGDDWEYDYEHIRDICDSNINQYTFTAKSEFYDGSQGGGDASGDPLIPDVLNALNAGVGLMNYCGHGSVGAFSTSGFGDADIPNMTNDLGEWPCIFSTACVNGDFVNNTCLAEAFLRAKNASNQPTGAAATLMSTINQSWDPPMQGQDEMNAILRGARPGNRKTTFGALAVNGFLSVNENYNTQSNPDMGNEITDTWTVFGDPTLEIKTDHLGQLQCTHPSIIAPGGTYFPVFSAVEGSSVGLYYKGRYLSSGIINGGIAQMGGFTPVSLGDTIFITGTKQNYLPYYGYAVVQNYPAAVVDAESVSWSLFPNPVTDRLRIQGIDFGMENNYRIFDITGRLVMQGELESEGLLVSELPSGVYQLQIRTGNQQGTRNFVKQ